MAFILKTASVPSILFVIGIDFITIIILENRNMEQTIVNPEVPGIPEKPDPMPVIPEKPVTPGEPVIAPPKEPVPVPETPVEIPKKD
jgi:hypothetical protein